REWGGGGESGDGGREWVARREEGGVRWGRGAKWAPPLRAAANQAVLWTHLKAGRIATVGSDHSPSPPEMKTDPNFFKVWGGISGIQHTLALLLTEGHIRRGVALPAIARLTSFDVATRFRLPPAKAVL